MWLTGVTNTENDQTSHLNILLEQIFRSAYSKNKANLFFPRSWNSDSTTHPRIYSTEKLSEQDK